ncbi:unnamed protein product [Tetraodon nigroviridis]|uniref:(spotted green pufferfish) hypothetical protein n=1 Tax=Tetraodon nigroviridis TaxID=99883 RepID=Q4SER9_TETNG|nr:unnamed protein product [Tetraodon nigroviridis]
MTTKTIHFMVNGRLEKAEFGSGCSAAEVKDLFRAAAEVGPHHILKMYNIKGKMVNISPQLEANSLDSYYRLEVVTSDVKGVRMPTELENMESRRVEQGNVFSPKLEGPGVSPPLPACVSRLHHLESKVMEDVGKPSEVVCELKSEVESFKRKLELAAGDRGSERAPEDSHFRQLVRIRAAELSLFLRWGSSGLRSASLAPGGRRDKTML